MPINDSYEPPLECSRSEAIAIGISWVIASHVAVCFASVIFLTVVRGATGFWTGLVIAAMSWTVFPFVQLLAGHVCGSLAHRLFADSTISVSRATQVLAVLFEFNLFAWVVVLSLIG